MGGVSDAVATVRAIYDAFARRDVEAALAHMASDIVFAPSGTAARLGRSDPYVGHDEVRQYFTDVETVWEDLTLRADDVRSTAEGVVVFGSVTGTTGGATYRAQAVWVWKVRGGKAVSMRVSALGGG